MSTACWRDCGRRCGSGRCTPPCCAGSTRRTRDKTSLPDNDPARRCHRAAAGPRRLLSRPLGGARRAHGRRRRAQHRGRGQASSSRDIDGVVLGDGFTPRVVDAFLTVLSEDTRFRNLAGGADLEDLAPPDDLANLEIMSGEPAPIAAHAMPLIRQRAFEARLNRTLRAIDAGGLLDPQTGLLTQAGLRARFRHRRQPGAGAGRRLVGGPLRLRSRITRAHSSTAPASSAA